MEEETAMITQMKISVTLKNVKKDNFVVQMANALTAVSDVIINMIVEMALTNLVVNPKHVDQGNLDALMANVFRIH